MSFELLIFLVPVVFLIIGLAEAFRSNQTASSASDNILTLNAKESFKVFASAQNTFIFHCFLNTPPRLAKFFF